MSTPEKVLDFFNRLEEILAKTRYHIEVSSIFSNPLYRDNVLIGEYHFVSIGFLDKKTQFHELSEVSLFVALKGENGEIEHIESRLFRQLCWYPLPHLLSPRNYRLPLPF